MDGVFKEERPSLFQSGRKNDRCQAQSPRKPVLRKRLQTVARSPSVGVRQFDIVENAS